MSSPSAAAGKRPHARKPSRCVSQRRTAGVPLGGAASDQASRLAAEIGRSLAESRTDALAPEAAQALMAALCRLHSVRCEAGHDDLPIGPRSGVTATDVMAVASGLLKAVNLAVFELGMWQSWTGR